MSIIGTPSATPANLTMPTGLQSVGDASAQLSQALATQSSSGSSSGSSSSTPDILQQASGLKQSSNPGSVPPTDAQSLGAMLSSPSALNPSGNEALGMANWGGFLPAGQATGSVPLPYTGGGGTPPTAAPSGATTGTQGSIVGNPPPANVSPSGAATGLFGLVN